MRIYWAENITDEQGGELKDQIRESIADPNYSIVTNFRLGWANVSEMALVEAYASTDQVAYVRDELEKGMKDPDYIVVFPFHVHMDPIICED